ncbi:MULTISPECIES: IS110 family transposase [Bacteroides]|jgi:transposase|nr:MULTISPECIES: IS110 family transposase [Bacteroides]MBV3453787.1 IS110 family transposase [Bacteroides xylanisolvens]MDC2625527.1 IS110 family transposase [Bacteroides ovatus]MDC2639414.1 IS110 family transposase [Bacteroides ovatus]MDC2653783.1 IS110 family transposase [Bacteroides ovatus]RJU53618.1 IS110 family transposase [Bacteroides sp. AM37-9]
MKVVCGLDVHKDSVFCCILCANGEKIQHKFGVLTEELVTLRDLMVSEGVEECAMESTSIYWIPIWRVLEGSVKLHLVNPYFIKQLPGKKSDVNDAEWIATCLSKELIASSFVPDDKIQRLRQYDRRIFDLNVSISRNLVKLDQCIQRCNIRISNYISTTDSKGYRSIVKLISQGVTDAEVLVKELHGRTINRHGRETLVKALTGVVSETDIDIIKQLVEEIELQQRHKDEAQEKMTALCMEWFPQEVENLQTIPGVKERSATSIIAEIGTDMTHFQTPKKLVSWVGLRPRNEESAGKIKARGITHGNRFVRKTMIECSWGAARMKESFFAEFSYRQCIERRKNKMKVQVAIARKILVAVWYVLSQGTQYIKPTDHYTAAHMTAV